MLVVFLPIFMAGTKIIYGYNFAAPLKISQNSQGNTYTEVSFFSAASYFINEETQ